MPFANLCASYMDVSVYIESFKPLSIDASFNLKTNIAGISFILLIRCLPLMLICIDDVQSYYKALVECTYSGLIATTLFSNWCLSTLYTFHSHRVIITEKNNRCLYQLSPDHVTLGHSIKDDAK